MKKNSPQVKISKDQVLYENRRCDAISDRFQGGLRWIYSRGKRKKTKFSMRTGAVMQLAAGSMEG